MQTTRHGRSDVPECIGARITIGCCIRQRPDTDTIKDNADYAPNHSGQVLPMGPSKPCEYTLREIANRLSHPNAHRIALAILSAHSSISLCSGPSIITRATGSVPE